ncbi:MAG: hypothetical protein H6581_02155 [Bacteroidia bacterium]|nr:hypothetical protein [Bacteroidia bacterium]
MNNDPFFEGTAAASGGYAGSAEQLAPSRRSIEGSILLLGSILLERFAWQSMRYYLAYNFWSNARGSDNDYSTISLLIGLLVCLLPIPGGWLADRVTGWTNGALGGAVVILT